MKFSETVARLAKKQILEMTDDYKKKRRELLRNGHDDQYQQIVVKFQVDSDKVSDNFLKVAANSIGHTAQEICDDIEFYQTSDRLKGQLMQRMMTNIRNESVLDRPE